MRNRSVPTDSMLAHLNYPDVAQAADWLVRVFGFQEQYRYGDPGAPDGAQLHYGDAWVMLSSPREGRGTPGELGGWTAMLSIFVDDVDAHYQASKAAGATITEELNETMYGERQYVATDLAGHSWLFSMHVKDVDPAEWATVASSP
jgi:uncharacterized glyoxalase superfamily protein PhnB